MELNFERKPVSAFPGPAPALAAVNSCNPAAFPVRAISTRPHCRTCQNGETGGIPVWETTRSWVLILPTNTEPLDDALVTRFITHLDIVKQLAALADQLEQTTA